MADNSSIAPGQLVLGKNGAVGEVELVDSSCVDGEARALTVRSADDRFLYKLPMDLVRRVKREQGHDVVVLRVGADELDPYIVERLSTPSQASTSPRNASSESDAATSEKQILKVPFLEEELTPGVRDVRLGTVHVHKGVATEEQTLRVPITREEAIIEHIAPEDFHEGMPIAADETIIPVLEERLVIEKRSVVKEYIRIRKQRVVENQEVSDTVRREYVEVSAERNDGVNATSRPLFREKHPTTDSDVQP
jgi:uncharacterized protein (TIGR02271 family)